MSFSTALSGLNAATADLNVKSNNIANVNTTGFKESRAEFGDVFAVSAFGTTSKTATGNGVVLQNVAQQFSQGNLEFTDNALDLAISGEGFFAMAPELNSGEVIYSRAGEFAVNKDGYVVSNEGWFLRTFPVDTDGNISATSINATSPIQLPPSVGAPEATTSLSIATNLPSNSDPISTGGADLVQGSYTTSSSLTISDFSTDQVSFEVDGTLVTLNADYGSLSGVASEIQSQLTGYSVALDATNNIVFTAPDENAPVIANYDGDVDGGGATVADFTAGSGSAGSAAVTPSVLAIDPSDPASYSFSTSATVYDSLGNEHIVTTYYQKIDAAAVGDEDNQWQMAVYLDGGDVKGGTEGVPYALETNARLSFNPDGTLGTVDADPTTAAIEPINLSFTDGTNSEWASGASTQSISLTLAGSTQNSGPFNVGALTVNGFPTGRLTGVDVSDDGLMRATYSNGQAVPIGKIALGDFANPQALNKIGNTAWKETTDSGPVIAGEAGTGSFGQIQAGALENSNVDLTKELVGLITAQRNFQANSKAIETNNAITQTIINLR
ncbi:Flagellar hook protein FlgE [Methylophaga thiooxydans]|uniref:Flagellar hook protein FlgE n=1 Tax=Methylophaga thiooxydans TaxID=392484 RepID=A0A0A0BM97_9GAMM|nr:flagellar hook protein FlgE [Methylophaga thiooxydans]KGM08184.1 Flagellar hook protein FlgE [Methylophaga thiooxydans]